MWTYYIKLGTRNVEHKSPFQIEYYIEQMSLFAIKVVQYFRACVNIFLLLYRNVLPLDIFGQSKLSCSFRIRNNMFYTNSFIIVFLFMY